MCKAVALGVILYELLTGNRPFTAPKVPKMLERIIHMPARPPSEVQEGLPADLDFICLRCLEKDPHRRYRTTSELANELSCFLRDEPLSHVPRGSTSWSAWWARRNGYELLEEVGRGGMGVVFRARQVRLNRVVALKMIGPQFWALGPVESDRACKALQRAKEEALRRNHNFMDTEHILLSLANEGSDGVDNILARLYLDPDKVRREVERVAERVVVPISRSEEFLQLAIPHDVRLELDKGGVPATILDQLAEHYQKPRVGHVRAYAIEEARSLEHGHVDPEHLLLGLLRAQEGVAAQVLANLGVKLEEIRQHVVRLLRDSRPFPVAGSDREWEALLGHSVSEEELRRFRVEAEAVASFTHQNVVQIYDYGEFRGICYFAMEFLEGGTLLHRIGGHPMAATEAAAIVEQMARAMAVAHRRGLVHRDLKPANVMFAGDDSLRVTDFSLVMYDWNREEDGPPMGTPSYMPPEQARGSNSEVGPCSDIYGLGATLYECLTGRPPFRGVSMYQTLQQLLHNHPIPPRQLNAKVPRKLEAIVMKCLQKNPARRYASALELADDLCRFLDRQVTQARRKLQVSGALAVLFLLVCGVTLADSLIGRADQATRAARQALVAKEEAVRHEREVTRRFVAFIKKNPDLTRLPGKELLRRFQQANPDLTDEDVARIGPSVVGD